MPRILIVPDRKGLIRLISGDEVIELDLLGSEDNEVLPYADPPRPVDPPPSPPEQPKPQPPIRRRWTIPPGSRPWPMFATPTRALALEVELSDLDQEAVDELTNAVKAEVEMAGDLELLFLCCPKGLDVNGIERLSRSIAEKVPHIRLGIVFGDDG